MQAKFFAALMGCCTLTAAVASDRQIPTVDLQDFKGQYDLVGGCVLSITQRGHRLVMQLGDQPEADIVAIGSATFVTRSGDVRLEFVQHPNGNVPAVRVLDTSNTSKHSCLRIAPDLSNGSSLVSKNMSDTGGMPPFRIN